MRMLVHAKFPLEPFNTAVRKRQRREDDREKILGEIKPEAIYFTEYDGRRGAIMIVDVPEPSAVPSIAEPWFLSFNAEVTFHIVMKPEDLGRAGLDAIGQKW
jgi:hypothetical protein